MPLCIVLILYGKYPVLLRKTKIQKKEEKLFFLIQEKNTPPVLWASDQNILIVVNNEFKLKQNKRDTYAAIFEDGTGTKAQVLWHSFRSPSFVVMYCKKKKEKKKKKKIYIYIYIYIYIHTFIIYIHSYLY